jgi:hypothetical protein
MFDMLCCGEVEVYSGYAFEELFGASGMISGLGLCEKVRVWGRERGGDLERNGCVVDGASVMKYNDLKRSLVASLRDNELTDKSGS